MIIPLSPAQIGLVGVAIKVGGVGAVIVAETVPTQPFCNFISTLYVPASKLPMSVPIPCP